MIPFLSTYTPHAIAVSIGPFAIHWYGLCLVMAIIVGYLVVGSVAHYQNITKEQAYTMYVNTLIWGIIGARVYHIFNEPVFYWNNPSHMLALWNGGLAIHGGLIAGALVLWYYARKYKLTFYALADLFVIPAIIGQAIGRWGNYFNQELFGGPTQLPWAIPIDVVYRPQGFEQYTHFHPTFLYESIWNLGVFALLYWLIKKQNKPQGLILWLYIGVYSIGRVITEVLRIDRVPIIGGIRLPLMVSVALAIAGCVMAVYVWKRSKKV